MSTEIKIEAITKRFANGVEAVKELNLDVGAGEFVVLVGPSGCGKSTLLRMVAGLEEPSDGRILIGGRDVTGLEPKQRDIAMVFQSYALFPHMTVADNIGFGLRMRRIAKPEISRRVAEAARVLELGHLLDRRPAALSGGQRQRVAMGRALVRDARAFLMDEPLSNLDAQLRGAMRTELREVHRRVGATTLYVTHDQMEAMTLGDRVAVLRDGRLLQVGSPGAIFQRPANVFVAAFIGSPAMNLLEGKARNGGVRIGNLTLPLSGPASGRLVAGLRPSAFEDAAIARDEGLPRLQVIPTAVEDLGDEKHVVFPFPARAVVPSELRTDEHADERDALVTARVHARSSARAGEPFRMTVNPADVHLFDADTGEALAQ
jgi:multiple sugar transport system ATP-binding protein